MEIIKNPNIDFLGKARYFLVLSVARSSRPVSLWIASGHLRYGVEFSGGTQLMLAVPGRRRRSTGSATPSPRSRRAR